MIFTLRPFYFTTNIKLLYYLQIMLVTRQLKISLFVFIEFTTNIKLHFYLQIIMVVTRPGIHSVFSHFTTNIKLHDLHNILVTRQLQDIAPSRSSNYVGNQGSSKTLLYFTTNKAPFRILNHVGNHAAPMYYSPSLSIT